MENKQCLRKEFQGCPYRREVEDMKDGDGSEFVVCRSVPCLWAIEVAVKKRPGIVIVPGSDLWNNLVVLGF